MAKGAQGTPKRKNQSLLQETEPSRHRQLGNGLRHLHSPQNGNGGELPSPNGLGPGPFSPEQQFEEIWRHSKLQKAKKAQISGHCFKGAPTRKEQREPANHDRALRGGLAIGLFQQNKLR